MGTPKEEPAARNESAVAMLSRAKPGSGTYKIGDPQSPTAQETEETELRSPNKDAEIAKKAIAARERLERIYDVFVSQYSLQGDRTVPRHELGTWQHEGMLLQAFPHWKLIPPHIREQIGSRGEIDDIMELLRIVKNDKLDEAEKIKKNPPSQVSPQIQALLDFVSSGKSRGQLPRLRAIEVEISRTILRTIYTWNEFRKSAAWKKADGSMRSAWEGEIIDFTLQPFPELYDETPYHTDVPINYEEPFFPNKPAGHEEAIEMKRLAVIARIEGKIQELQERIAAGLLRMEASPPQAERIADIRGHTRRHHAQVIQLSDLGIGVDDGAKGNGNKPESA